VSNYVFNSKLSYNDYIQARSFVDDISSATKKTGERVALELSRQTREVIASNEALSAENIRVMETTGAQVSTAMKAGFECLSYDLQGISSDLQGISAAIDNLEATFHWGFSQIIASTGHMNDSLEELVKIAKTPVQTVAFNHFEIARDAYRQGLFKECFEELSKAIAGDHTFSGYKLEWRFYQMRGTLQLGFVDGDPSLMDLAKAEETFLLAARYSKMDYPEHAGQAFLSAGWAAYCQGKMIEALAHTENAISIHPKLGEAFFQAAKVRMSLGEADAALPLLAQAIDHNRFFALKAAGDGDFQKHDTLLYNFLESLRREKYRQSVPVVQAALERFRFLREHVDHASLPKSILQMESFINGGKAWPIMDILRVVQGLDDRLIKIEKLAKESVVVLSTKTEGVARSFEEICPVDETYVEKEVVVPGGFFRREVAHMITKTRKVWQTRIIKVCPIGILRDDIYTCLGERLTSIEFCYIPAGSFLMGEKTENQVRISRDFWMGTYPVTQEQWESIMGENPSYYKNSNAPVDSVYWDDCQRFINKLNSFNDFYRLPTEAEWEYACRAGSKTRFFFGDNPQKLSSYAWCEADSLSRDTHYSREVGQKIPNEWGLYDMYGNINEGCQDWFAKEFATGPVTDPQGPPNGRTRVCRGNSCNSSIAYWHYDRSPWVSGSGIAHYHLGFRLVRRCL
jgi:tetratricopeptide (TPR) repeat protein